MLRHGLFALLIWYSVFVCINLAGRLEIIAIQAIYSRQIFSFSSRIHSNGTKFDIFVTLHQPFQKHDLLVNMRLKAKWSNDTNYRNIFRWKRIDMCQLLRNFNNNEASNYFFKEAPRISSTLKCPLKKGNYELLNLEVEQGTLFNLLRVGSYRLFTELAQASGDLVKIFNMQISMKYHN